MKPPVPHLTASGPSSRDGAHTQLEAGLGHTIADLVIAAGRLTLARVDRLLGSPLTHQRTTGSPCGSHSTSCAPTQIELIYELLDAHDETADIAAELVDDPEWECHLDYLRALQRKGREVLAQLSQDLAA